MRLGFAIALITFCDALKVIEIKPNEFMASAAKFGKSFKNPEEKNIRFANWLEKDAAISEINAKPDITF